MVNQGKFSELKEDEVEIELDDLDKGSLDNSAEGIKLDFSDPTDRNDDDDPIPKFDVEASDQVEVGEEDGELYPLAPITMWDLYEQEKDNETKSYRIPPWGLLYIVYFIAAYLLVIIAMVVIIIIGCLAAGGCEPQEGVMEVNALEIIFYICFPWIVFLGMPLALSIKQGNGPVIDYGLTKRPTDFAWGLGYGLLCIACGFLTIFISQLIVGDLDAAVAGLRATNTFAEIVFFILLAFGAPIVEEILFRGFIFTIFGMKRWHKVLVITLNGLFFALFHMEPARILILFTLGSILTAARVHTQSLTPSIIAHGVNNLLAAVLFFIIWSQHDEEDGEGETMKAARAARYLLSGH